MEEQWVEGWGKNNNGKKKTDTSGSEWLESENDEGIYSAVFGLLCVEKFNKLLKVDFLLQIAWAEMLLNELIN